MPPSQGTASPLPQLCFPSWQPPYFLMGFEGKAKQKKGVLESGFSSQLKRCHEAGMSWGCLGQEALRRHKEAVEVGAGGSPGCWDKFNSSWWLGGGTGQDVGNPWLHLCCARFQHHSLLCLHLDVGLGPGSIISHFRAVPSKQPFAVCVCNIFTIHLSYIQMLYINICYINVFYIM